MATKGTPILSQSGNKSQEITLDPWFSPRWVSLAGTVNQYNPLVNAHGSLHLTIFFESTHLSSSLSLLLKRTTKNEIS